MILLPGETAPRSVWDGPDGKPLVLCARCQKLRGVRFEECTVGHAPRTCCECGTETRSGCLRELKR